MRFFFFKSFVFLCALTSCTSSLSPWSYREIKSSNPSAFLSCAPLYDFNGLELRFLTGSFGTLGYLYVHNGTIVENPKEGQKIEVHYRFENNQRKTYATIMEGGQALLLPEKSTLTLLEALNSGHECHIIVNKYYSKVLPTHFSELYKKFAIIEKTYTSSS